MKPTPFWRRSRIRTACGLMLASAVLALATSAQPPAQPFVVLLGTPSLPLGLTATTIQESGEFRVQVNGEVDSAAIVLLVIHAPDGLVSSGVDELRRRHGKTLARAAILVTSGDVDPELMELVLLEAREVYGGYLGEEETIRLEVLKHPDPEFVEKLKALLFLPPVHLRITAPNR